MGASPGSGFGQGMTCGEEPTLGSPPATDSTNSAYGPSRLAFRFRSDGFILLGDPVGDGQRTMHVVDPGVELDIRAASTRIRWPATVCSRRNTGAICSRCAWHSGASCGRGQALGYVTSAEPGVMLAAVSEVSSTTFPSGSSTMAA